MTGFTASEAAFLISLPPDKREEAMEKIKSMSAGERRRLWDNRKLRQELGMDERS